MLTKYGTSYIAHWLFNQDKMWLTADGEWKFIADPGGIVEWINTDGEPVKVMHKEHVLNTLLFLERTVWDVHGSVFGPEVTDAVTAEEVVEWLHDTPLVKALKKRLLV